MSRLGGDTYYRVARTEADEDLLKRWLSGLHPEVRTAFLSALLVIDGQATIRQVVDGWGRLSRRLQPPDLNGVSCDEEVVQVVPRVCGYCGLPLPDVSGPGRPPLYHAPDCVQKAEALRRAESRRTRAGRREAVSR
jgi:hypothetical protein